MKLKNNEEFNHGKILLEAKDLFKKIHFIFKYLD
jgi:hypothetical protein